MSNDLEHLNSQLSITLLDSEMVASVKINTDAYIDPLPYEEIIFLLKQNNIEYGIDEELIKRLCAQPDQFLEKEIEIAKGLPRTIGDDAYLEWEASSGSDNKLKEFEDGRVDYHSVKQISNIKKGQLILKKIPSTFGEPGITVTGKEVAAKKGKEIIIKPGKNVLLNEEKDRLYSAIDGQIVITENDRINVFPIYEVTGDLDLSIGNIDFVGTVVIRGNVPDGFQIHADGDIKVYGNVEGAELFAGGNIHIQQGIIGHNKSLIKANGNVQAAFILDGTVNAKGNIIVSQSVMHSNVFAGKQLICKGLKGLIVGGNIQAGELVIASIIGNPMATATAIEVGINPDTRREWQELLSNKKGLEKSLEKINQGINLLNHLQSAEGGLTQEKKRVQVNLINQQLAIEKELKNLKIKETDLEEKLKSFEKSNIQVLKRIFPGVRITIGRSMKIINKETANIKYLLEDGEIVAKNL